MRYCIKTIRENAGITQSELAEKSGVTRATIWRLETGDNVITTTKTLTRIAEALNVEVDELFLPAKV